MGFFKHCILVLVLLLAAVEALAGGRGGVEIEKVDVDGIENFSRFDGPPGFAGAPVGFGGATGDSAMPWLKGEGFTTVIDLRLAVEDDVAVNIEEERTAAEAAGLKYIHLPFDPKGSDLSVVQEFLSVAGDEPHQPIYIHCNSATRAAALWIVGRLLKDGIDVGQAGKEGEAIAEKPEEAIAFSTSYVASQEQ